MMRRLSIAATAAIVAVATPTLAAGDKPPQREILRGAVVPVPFGADGSHLMEDLGGRARLVDGEGRDRISIRIRGLARRATYLWHIHEVDADMTDPCAHHGPVPMARGFKHYPKLVANRRGRVRATARARRFKARMGKLYFVSVDRRKDGVSVACSLLAIPAPEATPTATPTP